MVQLLNRVLLGLFCLSFLACSPTLRFKPGELPQANPPTQSLKVEAEQYVAAHANEENYPEISSGAELNRVRALVGRLSVAAGYRKDEFPVHLLDAGEEVNASAVNGASVIVYRELLERVHSDEELATVLAHEIGHILAEHYKDAKEEEDRATAVGIGSTILGMAASITATVAGYGDAADLAGGLTEATTSAVGYGAFVGSFSRTQEYEADHLGLLIMARAGYDPRIAISFWKRAQEVFGSSTSTAGAFFSTHPASSNRAEELEAALPLALQEYEKKQPTK